ncbi:uncharacterized protein LOC135848539 [Planococcus citri]|uniref:uncharacterized protein LOC135848539 n=1 Tax=Planococcus citri TaxID=170843 RepID=UPI0031F7F920
MNSMERIVLCILIIIATNTIHIAFGNQYEPLCVRKKNFSYGYELIQTVRYDTADTNLIVVESFGYEVLLACPREDDFDSLEIEIKQKDKATFDPAFCRTEIQSQFYTPSWPVFPWGVIGFPIFTPDEKSPKYNYYAHVPKNHAIAELIKFQFDYELRRIKLVHYHIVAGGSLNPKISERRENEKYYDDQLLLHHDVDELYSKTLLPVVKVQLAPADDFFFANWKSASRHNAITVPMWNTLLEQWQALEIFIRRVAQIIDSVQIRTGVHYDMLTQSEPGGNSETLYLHDGKHPIPKYFWKAVYIEIEITVLESLARGILFVMHNNIDPNFNSSERKICPNDDVSELGWKFLPGNHFKSLMYGCFLNEENLKAFQEKIFPTHDHKPFDLRDVPVKEYDNEGIFPTWNIKRVNVLDEMQKLQQAKAELLIQNETKRKTQDETATFPSGHETKRIKKITQNETL